MTPDERAKSDAFWQPLIRTDGVLDETKILNELSDYSFLLENVPQVYMEISNGKLSKPNYPASVMIGEFEQAVIDAVAEETADLEKGHAVAIAELEARLAMATEALGSLVAECTGLYGIVEQGLREAAGNTNVNCWKRRVDEAQVAHSATTPDIAAFLQRVERRGAAKALKEILNRVSPDGLPYKPKYPYELTHILVRAIEAAELERP